MNLTEIDLNLLTLFDALMVERSTTRAARRLKLSQPATSHALNRLRLLLEDDLFIRGGDGMQPTARALEIAGPIRHALEAIGSALEGPFDPGVSTRRFTLATQSYASIVLLPYLVGRLRREAPLIGMRTISGPRDDLLDRLDQGRLDLALGNFPDRRERFLSETLLTDTLVCLMRADHPLAQAPLTLEAYAATPHLVIAVEDEAGDPVDRILAEHGMSRQVAMAVPHLLSALIVLPRSDMVATLTRRVAESFLGNAPLVIRPTPFAAEPETLRMVWHRRQDRHPAQLWLRRLFTDAAAGVDAMAPVFAGTAAAGEATAVAKP